MNKLISVAILGLFGLVSAQEYYDDTWSTGDWEYEADPFERYYDDADDDVKVLGVNAGRVNELLRNLDEFTRQDSSRQVDRSAQRVIRELANSLKNTEAKIILNWGRYFAPVVESVGELSRDTKVNDECDQTCAVECYTPGSESAPFDFQCLSDCGCYFPGQTITESRRQEVQQQVDEFLQEVENLDRFTNQLGQEFNSQDLQRRQQELAEAIVQNQEDYRAYVKKQTIEVLNCDPDCVNDCTDGQFISIFETPQCLQYCACDHDLYAIQNAGEFNYPALISYSQHDVKAWSFFKLIKNKL
jgi:hypothetical protein